MLIIFCKVRQILGIYFFPNSSSPKLISKQWKIYPYKSLPYFPSNSLNKQGVTVYIVDSLILPKWFNRVKSKMLRHSLFQTINSKCLSSSYPDTFHILDTMENISLQISSLLSLKFFEFRQGLTVVDSHVVPKWSNRLKSKMLHHSLFQTINSKCLGSSKPGNFHKS